jgi:hypothetical protein
MSAAAEWHIPHLIPQHDVITLDGPNGVGKTLFAAHLLARFSRVEGHKVLYCFSVEQEESALYFTAMQNADSARLVVQQMNYPPSEVSGQICVFEPIVNFLTKYLTQHKPTFCVVDGLDNLLEQGTDLPTHAAMQLWRKVRDLAHVHQCTIVILRHKGLHENRLYGNVTKTASRVLRHGLTMHWHPTDPAKRLINVARRQYGPIGEQFHITLELDGSLSLREALGNLKEEPANKCRAWKHNPVALKQEKAALGLATEFMTTGIVSLKEVQQMLQKQGLPGKVINRVLQRGNFGVRQGNGECYLTRPDYDATCTPADTRPKTDSTFPWLKPVKPYTNLAEVVLDPVEAFRADSRRKTNTDNNIPRAMVDKPSEVSMQAMAG